MSYGGAPKCPRCSKSVYKAEEVIGAAKSWHKLCFTCRSCNKTLDSSTLAEHDGEIFCKSCHSKQFGPKGFGYGIGAGALAETSGPSEIKPVKTAPAGPQSQTFATSAEGGAEGTDVAVNLSKNPKYMGTDICPRCDKKVYFAEKVIGAGVSWHKTCFACIKCRKGLESTTMTERAGQIYCKGCYAKYFGPKGFGYGVGAGALAHAT